MEPYSSPSRQAISVEGLIARGLALVHELPGSDVVGCARVGTSDVVFDVLAADPPHAPIILPRFSCGALFVLASRSPLLTLSTAAVRIGLAELESLGQMGQDDGSDRYSQYDEPRSNDSVNATVWSRTLEEQ